MKFYSTAVVSSTMLLMVTSVTAASSSKIKGMSSSSSSNKKDDEGDRIHRVLKGDDGDKNSLYDQAVTDYCKPKVECGGVYYGVDIKLTSDLVCDTSYGGIYLEEGASLDCDGYTITGPGERDTERRWQFGITVVQDGVTIKNCAVTNFKGKGGTFGENGNFGIAILDAGDVVMENVHVYDNTNGILAVGKNIELQNSKIHNNDNDGIFMYEGSYNIGITNVDVRENGGNGIILTKNTGITIQDSVFNENVITGIYATTVEDITITNVQALSNGKHGIAVRDSSSDIKIEHVMANENLDSGIVLTEDSGIVLTKDVVNGMVTIHNVVTKDNDFGLVFNGSTSEDDVVTIKKVVSTGNNVGIFGFYSDVDTMEDIFACGNQKYDIGFDDVIIDNYEKEFICSTGFGCDQVTIEYKDKTECSDVCSA